MEFQGSEAGFAFRGI